ncbi:MAG: hypothetical protein E7527_00655 [Ruminococcaceae bacterium]|nr:hypothetical protein [Oscillospiraceae bacterium]
MKSFLKRTGLYYLYNTLAIFAGELIGVFPTLALRLVFQETMNDAYLIQGVVIELSIVGVLFFLMQRDIYEKRQFSFKTVMLSALIVCIVRWLLWIGTSGKIAFWVTGGATSFSPVFFPNVSFVFWNSETVFYDLLSTIICDILFILPAFIGGGYYGYWRRVKENEKMIKEHEETTK